MAQIREETGPIFYAEKVFFFNVSDFDSELLCRFTKIFRRVAAEFGQMRITNGYHSDWTPNWANLIDWCRAYHDSRTVFVLRRDHITIADPNALDPRAGPLMTVAAMFSIVDVLRQRPWEEVEKMLLLYREVLGAFDRRWMG